jgi:hypothetical protein
MMVHDLIWLSGQGHKPWLVNTVGGFLHLGIEMHPQNWMSMDEL